MAANWYIKKDGQYLKRFTFHPGGRSFAFTDDPREALAFTEDQARQPAEEIAGQVVTSEKRELDAIDHLFLIEAADLGLVDRPDRQPPMPGSVEDKHGQQLTFERRMVLGNQDKNGQLSLFDE